MIQLRHVPNNDKSPHTQIQNRNQNVSQTKVSNYRLTNASNTSEHRLTKESDELSSHKRKCKFDRLTNEVISFVRRFELRLSFVRRSSNRLTNEVISFEKGSVESTHKVPTSFLLRKGQLNRHTRYLSFAIGSVAFFCERVS